jgi:hypothetical protein
MDNDVSGTRTSMIRPADEGVVAQFAKQPGSSPATGNGNWKGPYRPAGIIYIGLHSRRLRRRIMEGRMRRSGVPEGRVRKKKNKKRKLNPKRSYIKL